MSGSGCDHDVAAIQRLISDAEAGWANEVRSPLNRTYPGLGEAPLVGGGGVVDEGVLEADHVLPDERRRRRRDAPALHASSPIDELRDTDENLFRVTTPQRAGA